MAKRGGATTSPGPGVDAQGLPVVDPTANVLDKVMDAVKRLDDLASLERTHNRDMGEQRDRYEERLRVAQEKLGLAESARLDAIHAADVAAADRGAITSAAQQATLATQVETTAVTLRNQVEATRVQTADQLQTVAAPLQTSIAELTRALYSGEGALGQQRSGRANSQWAIGAAISGALVVITLVGLIITLALSHTTTPTTPQPITIVVPTAAASPTS